MFKKLLFYVLCFQDVTEIIDDVAELFKKLIVRRPLGLFLENTMKQLLRRNSSINFTLPMVNTLLIPTINISVVYKSG